MAAPTYVATGTFAADNEAVSPGLPAGLTSGVSHMYLLVSTANDALDPIEGWIVLSTVDNGGTPGAHGAVRLTVLHRVYQAGDTDPTVPSTSSYCAAQIFAFDGVGSHDALATGFAAAGTGDRAVPAITTSQDDCAIVVMLSSDRSIDSSGTQLREDASAAPSFDEGLLIEIVDEATRAGGGGTVGGFYGTKASAGLIDDTTYRLGGSAYDSVHVVLALAPVSDGSSVRRRASRGFCFL